MSATSLGWRHLVNAYMAKAWCGWLGRWCLCQLQSQVQLSVSSCNGWLHLRCSTTGSCKSTVTSEIVKHIWTGYLPCKLRRIRIWPLPLRLPPLTGTCITAAQSQWQDHKQNKLTSRLAYKTRAEHSAYSYPSVVAAGEAKFSKILNWQITWQIHFLTPNWQQQSSVRQHGAYVQDEKSWTGHVSAAVLTGCLVASSKCL